jgi:predicted dehydrogenase
MERFAGSFVRELEHFVDCIIHNKTPLITGTDAKKALEIALAATKSCQKGIPITLES